MWRNHGKVDERVAELLSARGDEVAVVRLCGRRQVAHWLRGTIGVT